MAKKIKQTELIDAMYGTYDEGSVTKLGITWEIQESAPVDWDFDKFPVFVGEFIRTEEVGNELNKFEQYIFRRIGTDQMVNIPTHYSIQKSINKVLANAEGSTYVFYIRLTERSSSKGNDFFRYEILSSKFKMEMEAAILDGLKTEGVPWPGANESKPLPDELTPEKNFPIDKEDDLPF